MTSNQILEYTPGQAANFVDGVLGQSSTKEDKKKTKREEREEREEAARGRDRDRRNRDRAGDRNGNRDRSSWRDRSRSRAREVEVGRFPSNWALAVDSKGDELCISYQLGNCKRNEKDCPDKRVHLCANVLEKTEPLKLCLEDHMAKKCKKRKKE